MIQILTDTIPNLPRQVIERYGIHIVPVYVTVGTDTYRDYVDLTSTEFYTRLVDLDSAAELPSTSQPPVSDFVRKYREIANRHPRDTILSIHISGRLSGTVESARGAVGRVADLDIRVFDTRSVAVAHGLMVIEAARLARQGRSADSIIETLEAMREGMQFFMALDTLAYLERSGRIGRAARLLGTLLDMKPVLTLKDGAVESYERYRTWGRARDALRDMVRAGLSSPGGLLGVCYATNDAESEAFAEALAEHVKPREVLIAEVGPALGVHTGPGTLGVAWYPG